MVGGSGVVEEILLWPLTTLADFSCTASARHGKFVLERFGVNDLISAITAHMGGHHFLGYQNSNHSGFIILNYPDRTTPAGLLVGYSVLGTTGCSSSIMKGTTHSFSLSYLLVRSSIMFSEIGIIITLLMCNTIVSCGGIYFC